MVTAVLVVGATCSSCFNSLFYIPWTGASWWVWISEAQCLKGDGQLNSNESTEWTLAANFWHYWWLVRESTIFKYNLFHITNVQWMYPPICLQLIYQFTVVDYSSWSVIVVNATTYPHDQPPVSYTNMFTEFSPQDGFCKHSLSPLLAWIAFKDCLPASISPCCSWFCSSTKCNSN